MTSLRGGRATGPPTRDTETARRASADGVVHGIEIADDMFRRRVGPIAPFARLADRTSTRRRFVRWANRCGAAEFRPLRVISSPAGGRRRDLPIAVPSSRLTPRSLGTRRNPQTTTMASISTLGHQPARRWRRSPCQARLTPPCRNTWSRHGGSCANPQRCG
jgi:hypothetical protein